MFIKISLYTFGPAKLVMIITNKCIGVFGGSCDVVKGYKLAHFSYATKRASMNKCVCVWVCSIYLFVYTFFVSP